MDKAQFGMIGLGTMGRNFLLNVAEHGISGVGYDLDPEKRDLLLSEGTGMPLDVGSDLADFIAKLESPHNIMLLVPAGPIVDSVIADLVPHLNVNDLIIDGGNSHFTDTERREAELAGKSIGFLGVGVSGGEEGARHGASIMVGGRRDLYERVKDVFTVAAADFNGPCVGYMGTGSAGHFVKMVHNGIEYAMMQLISEAYDYMRRVLRMNIPNIQQTFKDWDDYALNSYLLRITWLILGYYDAEKKHPLLELILDTAGQKGTGKWTSQAAMDLGVPVPTIDISVTMRQISAQKERRVQIAEMFKAPTNGYKVEKKAELEEIHDALLCGYILAYEQGFSLLRAASDAKSYELDLSEVAAVWRFGCIIRSSVLQTIRKSYTDDLSLPTLLLDKHFADVLYKNAGAMRRLVSSASLCRIPVSAFASALNYYTAFRTERLPAYLIQAQRDAFGAHTYQRTDKVGIFHTPDWDTPKYWPKDD